MQVCSYFLAGYCAYGKNCHFAHLQPDGTPLPGEDVDVAHTREPNSQTSSTLHAEDLYAISEPSAAYSGRADAAWQEDEAAWASYRENTCQAYADEDHPYEEEAWDYGTGANHEDDVAWQEWGAEAGEVAHVHQEGAPERRLPMPVDLGDAW